MMILSLISITGCIQEEIPLTGTTGNIIFAITDEAADMESISEIKVTTNNIKAHSTAEGWVTVSNEEKTFNLLELQSENVNKLMASSEIEQGSYNKIQIGIDTIMVTDASGEHEAKVPSNTWNINCEANVKEKSNATILLDIQADSSLHITGNNNYIFAPVIMVESRNNATVTINTDNNVVISSGTVRTSTTVGMNINGTIGVGIQIPANANLSINAEGNIEIGDTVTIGNEGRVLFSITDDYANMESVSKVEVRFDSVEIYSESEGWISLSTEEKTFDLIALKTQGINKVMVDTDIESETYSKIRFSVDEVMVTDVEVEYEATLLSDNWVINNTVDVENNMNTSVNFDFIVNESVFVDSEGSYIFAPAIDIETRNNADITIQMNNQVSITGGTVASHVKVGMNIDGEIGVGLGIDPSANLTIGVDGSIDIGP